METKSNATAGFYILYHEDFSLISAGLGKGPKMLFKVGHSGELQRRIHDSSYTTILGDSCEYVFVLETENKENAEKIERSVLRTLHDKRRGKTEMILGLSAKEIRAVAVHAAQALNIRAVAVDYPKYERPTPAASSPEMDEFVGSLLDSVREDENKRISFSVSPPVAISSSALAHALPWVTPQVRAEGSSSDDDFVMVDRPLDVQIGDITERAYQTEAIAACIDELDRSHRAILQMACRCGKTKVAHGIMNRYFSQNTAARVAYLVPGLPLLRQTAQKLLGYGGAAFTIDNLLLVGSDPISVDLPGGALRMTTDRDAVSQFIAVEDQPRIVLCMYQSSHLLPEDSTFSLIVFDEAHKICGKKESKPTNRVALSEGKEDRLFMTATPDFSDKNELSMSNREVFGGVAYRYYLRQGIDAGYVNDFRLCLVAAAESEENPLAAQIEKAMSEPDVNKLLVFCQNRTQHVEDLAGQVRTRIAETKTEFECITAHSRMSKESQKKALTLAAKEGGRSALFNCRLFQEGVEFPKLNGVFFAAPRRSVRDIIQSMCRPLNRLDDKPKSVIFLPVIVPDSTVISDTIDDKRFSEIVAVFEALVHEDPRLYEYLLDPRKNYPIEIIGTASSGLKLSAHKNEILRAMRRAARKPFTRSDKIPWKFAFGALEALITKENRYPFKGESAEIGQGKINISTFLKWCGNEYKQWKSGAPTKLHPHQIRQLEELPRWDPFGMDDTPYPPKLCLAFLETWMDEHDGEMPMISLGKSESQALDATDMERLCGYMRIKNQQDSRTKVSTAQWEQDELDRIYTKHGRTWRKRRMPDGTVDESDTSEVQKSGHRLSQYYSDWKKGKNDGEYIRTWFIHGQYAAQAPTRKQPSRRRRHETALGAKVKRALDKIAE